MWSIFNPFRFLGLGILSTAGGIGGGPASIGGAAWMSGLPRLLKFLGGKRNTEALGPGSFPGHNPDGSPIEGYGDPESDPYRYANFSMPGQNQQPIGTLPGGGTSGGGFGNLSIGRFPNLSDVFGGPKPGTQTGPTARGMNFPDLGKIGSGIWKGLNSDFGQTALGAGIGLIGAKMGSNQMNRANQINQQNSDRSYQMAQEEKARRDALIRMIMPMLAQGMQVSDPSKVQQMVGGQ